MRVDRAELCTEFADRIYSRAFWKCTGKQRKRCPIVPKADRRGRSGDGDSSGSDSVFYDDPGGREPCPAMRRPRQRRRNLHPGYGGTR